jgi:sugar lactone lactonase YvrE
MHTRGTFESSWRRNATVAAKLALWMSIALLLAAALPGVGGAIGSADASAARPERMRVPPIGAAAGVHGRAHSPAAPRAGLVSASAFTDGQAASLVLGQADFTSSGGATSASGMFVPDSVAIDPTTGKLFVADFHNHRVLRFASSAALANGAAAEGVLGQPNFTSNSAATSAAGMRFPTAVALDSAGRLWVADHDNARVLRFDGAAGKPNGAAAEGVLGQPNFTSGAQATTASRMSGPGGLAVDTTGHLWVADTLNNRVLRFDGAAGKPNGANADGVLGQPDFTSSAPDFTASGMYGPGGLAIDSAGHLWVADSQNDRVLRFDGAAGKANGANADGVLGQPNFTGGGATTASSMDRPVGLAVDTAGRLWVADFFNNRVLRFDGAAGKPNGANADGVLGQPNFTSNGAATTASGMNSPGGLAIDTAGHLWVADNLNSRVLRFDGDPLPALSGRVVDPTGQPFFSVSSPNPNAGISVIGSDGTYIFVNLASDGSFSIALEAGLYEIWVWLDSATYPGIAGPEPFTVSVSGPTSIGDIALVARSALISGNVAIFASPAVGVPIIAWDTQGGQFSTTTDGSGHYSLAVTPGIWQVSPDLTSSGSYIFSGDPEIREIGDGQTDTVNFQVEQSSGTITGLVINQQTSVPVTNIDGWAYVTRNDGEVLKWAPISNSGSFSMPAPSVVVGDVLRVGLYLDPDSDYTSPGEITLDNSAAPNFPATIPVLPHNATITGKVYIADDPSHTAVTEVIGQVVLTQLDDSGDTSLTKSAPIDPATGRYSVNVLPGNWLLTYQIFMDDYQLDLSEPLSVTAVAAQIVPLDLPLTSLDGFITAVVRDQNGVPQPNITVWVRYGTQEVYAETDTEGVVTVYVPFSSLGLASRMPNPQGQEQPPLKIGTSNSSCKKPSKPNKSPSGNDKCKNSSVVLTKAPTPKPKPFGLLGTASLDAPVMLQLRDTNSTLTGRVLNAGGLNARADAFVSAWSSNGQWISGITAADGTFSLPIVQDTTITTTWQLSASYWDSSAEKLLSKRASLSVPIGQAPSPIAAGDITLEQLGVALPSSESLNFNNSDGLTLPLSDGTLIQIPPDAMPDGFGATIRITVDPQITLPSTDLNRLARHYGYVINLYDVQNGRPIDQPLKQPATITFSYTSEQLQQLGISEGDLQPAQFADDIWHVAQGFLQDTQGDVKTISLETTTLDTWALVVEQPVAAQAGGARVYLPLVVR